MKKKWIICGILALYTIVILVMVRGALTKFRDELGDPVEQVQVVETTLPKADPDHLPNKAVLVYNDAAEEYAVVYKGDVLARGSISPVRNAATNKMVGYCVSGMEEAGNPHYELYHLDGTYWQDCGDMNVIMVVGDYFVAADDCDPINTMSKDPANPEAERVTAYVLQVGDNTCAVWNITGDFMGINGFALLDGNGNVLSRMQKRAQEGRFADLNSDYPGYHYYVPLEEEPHYLVDLQNLNVLKYTEVRAINDGYMCFTDSDGKYTLKDAAGNTVASGSEKCWEYYSESVQLLFDKDYNYTLLVNDEEPLLGEEYAGSAWDNGLCIYSTDMAEAWLFDFDGKLAEHIQPDPGCSRVSVQNEYNCLLISTGKTTRLINTSGTIATLDGGEYFMVSSDGCYVLLNYPENRAKYTLITEDGTVLEEQFDYLYPSDVDGVLTARKGFVCGLVDRDGNWLWNEPIFNANSDEFSYNQWDNWRYFE